MPWVRETTADRPPPRPLPRGWGLCLILLAGGLAVPALTGVCGHDSGRAARLVVPRDRFGAAAVPARLDLMLSPAGDADLARLADSTGLRTLDLFGTRVTDAGLAHLAGLTGLRALYLESTGVGDAGLVHLGRLTALETLTLSGTRVTDAGLARLKALRGLRALDLSGTAVTDRGVDDLRRALPGAVITH